MENIYVGKKALKCLKFFEKAETAGTEVSYRCIRCRGCVDCKKSEKIECISIAEEVEQGLIDKSVNVVPDEGYTMAKLPFVCDPVAKLASNKHIAEKILWSSKKFE